MKTAVFKTSHKENEKRIPIHPAHIHLIDKQVLQELVFEKGYAEEYGYSDDYLISLGCSFSAREDLFKTCEILLLPKPVLKDLAEMKHEQILCGWTHAVQQTDIAEVAIRKKLTLIAWEEMNHVDSKGKIHIFYRNNELAGYAGVIHFLQLVGADGHYGEKSKITIFGYGSVSRGAIYALKGRGYTDITVYTKRPSHLVIDKNPDVKYRTFDQDVYLEKDLKESDIIFNGIMQDVNSPHMFVKDSSDLAKIKSGANIIDISCDKGMGFFFAKPTTFEDPIIYLERGIKYYSVDHTPTYLWDSASQEISKALLPYLEYIVNMERWSESKVICKAIDILKGTVINPNIIKFQNR